MPSITRRKGHPYDPSKQSYRAARADRVLVATTEKPRTDHMAKNLGIKVMVAPMVVLDPWQDETKPPGQMITVIRNLRDDPLGERHARGTINDAQYLGGRAYQRDFGLCGGSGAKAINFMVEAVDGGLRSDGSSLARVEAMERLGVAHNKLGENGSAITQDVLVRGYTIATIASNRGYGRSWHDHFGKLFVECLDCLALVYNYAMRSKSS